MIAIPIMLAAALLAPVAKNEGNIGAGEGPLWNASTGELYFTGRGRIYRRDSKGEVHVFREPPNGANGIALDREGRLVACETQNRRITRTEKDGSITVLTDNFEGKKYNSPNDLTIDSKGRIYFSDPRYGRRENMEVPEAVYRIDGPGRVTRVISHETVDRPNGVLVSADDKYLYVADNNNNNVGAPRKLWRFHLKSDGSIDPQSRKLMFDWENGRGPDGLKMDKKGRLYVAAGVNKENQYEKTDKHQAGIYVIDPKGKLLQFVRITVDEVTNCAFGGKDLKTLFVTAGGTLWSLQADTAGR